MDTIGYINNVRQTDYEIDIEWVIEDFYSLLTETCSYESPTFFCAHTKWNLNIEYEDQCIGLYIWGANSGSQVGVMFKFGLRLMEGKTEMRCCLTKHFNDPSTGFGTYEFILLSELEERKHDVMPSGVLTIMCSIGCLDVVTKPEMFTYQSICYKDLDDLSRNFKALFDCQKNSDVTIIVGEKEFPVHKIILTARSTVFAAMFENEMSEKKSGLVKIADCDPTSFKYFLLYLYTGKAENLSASNVCHIYRIADKYNVLDLKSRCRAFIERNISVSNLLDVIILANQFDETELLSGAQDFFYEHALEIISGDDWEPFLKQNFPVANQLLIRTMEKVKSGGEVKEHSED